MITQEDYEEFATRRPALSQRLRNDLIHRSFLFIGYGYEDPDIETVIVEARRLSDGATREHFLIAKKLNDSALVQRQELWLNDLEAVWHPLRSH